MAKKKAKSKEKTPVTNPWGLPEKHAQFVRIYLTNGRNATQAYREVYPKNRNPDADGPRLLGNPRILAVIQSEDQKVQKKFEVTHERIIHELAQIAYAKPTDFIEWFGDETVTIKNSDELTEDQKAGIAGVEQGMTESGDKFIRMKHYDRVSALKTLHKLAGCGFQGKGKNDSGSGSSDESRKAVLKRLSDLTKKYKD